MHFVFYAMNLLAEAAADGGAPAADPNAPQPGPPGGMLFWVAIPMLFIWMLLFRPDKKAAQQQKQMLDNLKQNDRVLTSGGIYGIVTNVQRDANRVTLRVDDSNNTKISVTVGSISQVLVDAPEAEKDKASK